MYSLGATLWHLLVGHSPFEIIGTDSIPVDNSREVLEERIHTMAPPATGRTDVPKVLEELLARALAKQPAGRPRTAKVFGSELAQIRATLRPGSGEDLSETTRPSGLSAELTHTAPRRPATIMPAAPPKTPDPTPRRPDPAPRRPGAAPAETARRPMAPESPPPPESAAPPQTSRRLRWVLAAAVLTVALVGGILAVDGSGSRGARARASASAQDGGEQDAGALGENMPPGVPVVTATRVSAATIRFTWTYSAPLATDTFTWRTQDGARSGIAKDASVDLPVAAAEKPCLQVKVVRADGANANAEWSPAGCGS